MSNPGVADKRFGDVLAENGRPVTPQGLQRARATLAAARARRNPEERAAFLAELRAAVGADAA